MLCGSEVNPEPPTISSGSAFLASAAGIGIESVSVMHRATGATLSTT